MKQETYPQAVVKEIDGELVLFDPAAEAMIKAVGKDNCRATFTMNADRIIHFKKRISERNDSPKEVVIVVISVDDPNGRHVADALMPGCDWQKIRDKGEIPFARGLAFRSGMQEVVDQIDSETGKFLRDLQGTAVIVIDHGTVEVFELIDTEE